MMLFGGVVMQNADSVPFNRKNRKNKIYIKVFGKWHFASPHHHFLPSKILFFSLLHNFCAKERKFLKNYCVKNYPMMLILGKKVNSGWLYDILERLF